MSHRRFLLLCAAFLLLILAAWTALFAGLTTRSNVYSTRYHTMVRDKLAFATSLPDPKIVCLGGSSVLFGIHARELQEQTGLPAVNLGLTVTLSVDYFFHLAEQVLRPGDVALIAFEYQLYADEGRPAYLIQYVLSQDPAYFGTLPWKTRAQWVFGLSPNQMKRLYNNSVNNEIHSPVLGPRNAWGDLEETHDAERPSDSLSFLHHLRVQAIPPLRGEPAAFASVRRFHAWCRAHGVRVVATFPPLVRDASADAGFAPFTSAMAAFYAKEGIPLLGSPWETLRPPDLFFDNPYHLTWEGAEERTACLAAELKGAGLTSGPRTASR